MPWRIYNVPEKVKLKHSSVVCAAPVPSARVPSLILVTERSEIRVTAAGVWVRVSLQETTNVLVLAYILCRKRTLDIMIPLVRALIAFLRTLPYQLHEFSKAPPLRTISWRCIYQHFNWETIYTQKQAQKVNLYSFLLVQLSWNSARIWLSNKVIM